MKTRELTFQINDSTLSYKYSVSRWQIFYKETLLKEHVILVSGLSELERVSKVSLDEASVLLKDSKRLRIAS